MEKSKLRYVVDERRLRLTLEEQLQDKRRQVALSEWRQWLDRFVEAYPGPFGSAMRRVLKPRMELPARGKCKDSVSPAVDRALDDHGDQFGVDK